MVGPWVFFTTEATIKSKHFRRKGLVLMENTCFWQRSLTAKQPLHGAKGRKTANTHPESAFGWVLIGWALGCSLISYKEHRWHISLGPTRKFRHARVFRTHSDTQAVPAFHCIRVSNGVFSTRAFLKCTDTTPPNA